MLPAFVAEMDFDAAEQIKDAVTAAVAAGDLGYPHNGDLGEAFAEFAGDRLGWSPDPQLVFLGEQIRSLMSLVQRQHVPVGVIAGTQHLLTEGTFSFPVSRLLGLDVVVTAVPAESRSLFGQPPYHTDLGWISVSDQEAMLQEIRITRDRQRWLPSGMQLATQVGIALRPGVTATVTELAPEAPVNAFPV